MNRSQRRRYLAAEAISLGRGDGKEIIVISGMYRIPSVLVYRQCSGGLDTFEIDDNRTPIRASGGDRKSILEKQPGILDALERIVDSESYGNRMPRF